MILTKKAEFLTLFEEFAQEYPYTALGLRHTAAYEKQRRQGKRNFEAIKLLEKSGEDLTEAVLLGLLPYKNLEHNRHKGAWIHHAACIDENFEVCFKSYFGTEEENWQKVASAIWIFVSNCFYEPNKLQMAKISFHALRAIPTTELLSPILNALQPSNFLLITHKSQKVINYFSSTSYSLDIEDYPNINTIGRDLIQKLSHHMQYPGLPALPTDDLFDMFCHWLVAIKKYDLSVVETAQMEISVELPSEIEGIELQPEYTLAECAEDTGVEEKTLLNWLQAIERKQQAIFYGPPGTGKTYIAKKLAQHLIGGGDGFMELVQFHPAYAYEDFVQGIRPQRIDGELEYPLVPGRFMEFCRQARTCHNICLLIIDEINRANVARVFGELMYLLEYRNEKIPLAAGEEFSIPANVRIIGTMNTADRSIALVDHALRRRFAFISLYPNYEVLRRYHSATSFPAEKFIQTLKQLNQQINNPQYEVGISFFLRKDITEQIESIWRLEIEPYLEEYFFDQPGKVNHFRWEKVKQQLSL